MDYVIVWTQKALDEINAIVDYIAQDSVFHAIGVAEKIIEAGVSLTQFPFRGRVVPESHNNELRELFVYKYRIVYQIQNNDVEIVTVVHGSRVLDLFNNELTQKELIEEKMN